MQHRKPLGNPRAHLLIGLNHVPRALFDGLLGSDQEQIEGVVTAAGLALFHVLGGIGQGGGRFDMTTLAVVYEKYMMLV